MTKKLKVAFTKVFPFLLLSAPMILLTLQQTYLIPVSFILYLSVLFLFAFPTVAWVWWFNIFNTIYILIFYVPHLLIVFPSFQSVFLALTSLATIPYLLMKRKMFHFFELPVRLIFSLGLGVLTLHVTPMYFLQLGFIETLPSPPIFLGYLDLVPSPFSLLNWIAPITTGIS